MQNLWIGTYIHPDIVVDRPNDSHGIIASFCILSLLKYDRIFGKNIENDTYGVK